VVLTAGPISEPFLVSPQYMIQHDHFLTDELNQTLWWPGPGHATNAGGWGLGQPGQGFRALRRRGRNYQSSWLQTSPINNSELGFTIISNPCMYSRLFIQPGENSESSKRQRRQVIEVDFVSPQRDQLLLSLREQYRHSNMQDTATFRK
jgi:hypothetical protein